MGVDIAAYRARIGTFKHSVGHDVVTHDVVVDIASFRRIIIWEMVCVMMMIVILIDTKSILKHPHEFTSSIYEHWQIVESLMSLTFPFILEFIGYYMLLTAALPGLYSIQTEDKDGISTSFVHARSKCCNSKIYRQLMTSYNTNVVCAIGTVGFIGMLLLMAGVEPNPGPIGRAGQMSQGSVYLKRLGLYDYFPGKIELFDVISLNEDNNINLEGRPERALPWILLRQLVSVNDNAFCLDDPSAEGQNSESESEESSSEETDGSDEVRESDTRLSYLDVFLLAYQCCNPILQQLLFQKMFLCKFAVPFLLTPLSNDKPQNPIASIWPLRSLAVETCTEDTRMMEYNVLDIPVKCVAFCRIGRPMLSKSNMLNKIVRDDSSKTFFNLNCQSGKVLKSMCRGYIETFWLLKAGDGNDTFDDATMFFNMRGCVRNIEQQTATFMSKFVDTISVFIDSDKLVECESSLESMTSLFESVIIVTIGSMKATEKKDVIARLTARAKDRKHTVAVVKTSGKKGEQKSEENINKNIKEAIKEQIQRNHAKPFEKRLQECAELPMCTDEQTEECEYGKQKALQFCALVDLDHNFLSLKEKVTPIQSQVAKDLGTLLKDHKREKDIKVQEKKREDIDRVRHEIPQNITEPIKQVMYVLCENKSLVTIDFYLAWLEFYFSRRSRNHLSTLKWEHNKEWEHVRKLKHDRTKDDCRIRQIESEMDAASFSVLHIFREIGLIYDANMNMDVENKNIPSMKSIVSVIGKLMAKGRRFEIIDGDSFYLPHKWLTELFDRLDKEIQSSKIMTLSALGIQSSGKSTLLNTMFGALFSTRAGRCTRGIHAQLVSYRQMSEYRYILILDTEGLRPNEINDESHEHDNELATFITGLGNTTIVNVMGENTQEIRDVLQIVAHAFLRIRLANKNITLQNRCIMVQQNITAITARENMNKGLHTFIESLDEMTEHSAKSEGVQDIHRLDDVIKFDISSDIFFLKNVWQGDPPFARVKRSYSEEANKIKTRIFQQFSKVHKSEHKSLQSFILQTNDLWQGVLHENFVFSFRNSMERIAYLQMDEWIVAQTWEIERFVTETAHNVSQKMFSNCKTLESIDTCAITIDQKIRTMIDEKESEVNNVLTKYFEESDRRSIIVQWEENQKGRVTRLFDKLRNMSNDVVRSERDKTRRNLKFHRSKNENEKALQKKTLEYAKSHNVKRTSHSVVRSLFEDFWKESFGTLDPSAETVGGLKEIFYNWLHERRNIQKQILDSVLQNVNWSGNPNAPFRKSLIFENSGIDDDDISTNWGKAIVGSNRYKTSAAKSFVDILYQAMNVKMESLCDENDSITESHVRELLQYLSELYKETQSQQGVNFKEKMFVKIAVHVSIVAYNRFEDYNKKCLGTLRQNYNLHKIQQWLLFENFFDLRKNEETIAEIITEVIDTFIDTECVVPVLLEIQEMFYGKLPRTKNQLILAILTDMVDAEEFEWIMSYIMNPLETVQTWFIKRADSILFEASSKQFSKCSSRVINRFNSNVKKGIASLKGSGDEMLNLADFLSRLCSYLQANNISISETYFGSVQKCHHGIKTVNVNAVCKAIDEKLETMIDTRIKTFSSYNKDAVWWKNNSPVDKMFKEIWGCLKKCPFCNEPCEKSTDSHRDDHTCVQHRPKCCRGQWRLVTGQAVCSTCNYSMYANLKHCCATINYECNHNANVWHKYRDYRNYFNKWSINQSSDMCESSRFWLWFCGKFKRELATRFHFKTDDMPAKWSQITKYQAKDSLRTTYKY